MASDIFMGGYEFYTNRESEWLLVDQDTLKERTFKSLVDLLDYLERELLSVEIDAS